MDESMYSVTLKNSIPIIGYKSIELLSKSERQLSKFFKCCSKEKKCFWSGNDGNKFKEHIQLSHNQVFCSYCLSEKRSDEEIKAFDAKEVDQLIEHLIQNHGRRVYQCNRCEYRANTCTHIQLHQISIHYHIWSKNNSDIICEALDDKDSDICKIIVCKKVTADDNSNPIDFFSKYSPDLDKDLAENLFYCLFCDHSSDEEIKVFMHCVQKHRDSDVCVYSKERRPHIYSDDSQSEVNSSDESDSEPEVLPINSTKSYVSNFTTQLSFNSEPFIPGIDETFSPPQHSSTKPYRQRYQERSGGRFGDRFKKKDRNRRQSYEPYFEDDFQQNFTPNDSAFEDMPTVRQPLISHTTLPSTSPSPLPQSIISPPSHQTMTTPSTSGGQKPKKKNKNWKKFHKLKDNEELSPLNYGQYKRQQKALLKANATSTPILKSGQSSSDSGIPPEIDLKQTEMELNCEGYRNNAFKQINRVGVKSSAVTYVPRVEETDEYTELLNERIPKRGVKARFENHSHFELIQLQSTSNQSSGLSYKCLLCKDSKLRENQITHHLRNIHKTDSSFKCGYCDLIANKADISKHSKVSHPNTEVNIHKFIVHSFHEKPIELTSSINVEKKTTARKSTAGGGAKGSKGALTQRIRESTYLGPLNNDVTKRKLTDENHPFQRVYYRSSHSSNIRPKKRQKLNISDSESELEIQGEGEAHNYKNQYISSDNESDYEMRSDVESGVEPIDSDVEDIQEVPKVKPKVPMVAKKSTGKPSSQETSQVSITLTEEQIPTQYFCVFCTDHFVINELPEAIEHYKTHLNLGYTCVQCRGFYNTYSSLESHWTTVHKSDTPLESEDNMNDFIRHWIIKFLRDQIKSADFAESIASNSTGISIQCPLCVKAATICNMTARAFDALWKVKLHICKHLNWFPMKCDLCDEPNILFPQNPYLLLKHLIDCHFTSCENLNNISFRGQKPFNDMKSEQLRLIEKNFSNVRVESSDIINSFFHQLMTELDLIYENQLKAKHNVSKEVQISVQRLIQVKSEPIDIGDQEECDEHKPEAKDEDKKDIKPLIKSEVKTEVKSEVKTEVKSEVKKQETQEDNEDLAASGVQFLSRLYGDDILEIRPSTSMSVPRPRTASQEEEDIVILSSDDEC